MSLNSYIAQQFGNPRGLSGKIVTSIMNSQNRPMYEATERLLSLSASETVLDIGCGNGYVLNLLAKRYPCMFTGIDISESIVLAASHRNHKFVRDGKVQVLCQNAESMSFADKAFDKAYTINTVYFWDRLENILTEIYRVLKPKGVFINTLYTNATLDRFSHTQYEYKQFTAKQLTDASAHAGFYVRTVPIVQGAAYCIVCQRVD